MLGLRDQEKRRRKQTVSFRFYFLGAELSHYVAQPCQQYQSLHKLGDFDTGADLNAKMAQSVRSLKTLLRHCSSLFDTRDVILKFVDGSTFQFYIALHTGSFKVPFGGLHLCPFPDSRLLWKWDTSQDGQAFSCRPRSEHYHLGHLGACF
jgi:hypothetical protein